jgi:hypothetical protein
MSNSASARFGLKNYSATGCALWKACNALFVMEKIMGVRGNVGCAAHRGTASEHGVAMGLMDPSASLEACQEAALKEFDRLTALSGDPNREKERAAVPGIVEQGLIELRPYGVPTHTQEKIEWQHPDLPLPFVGYIDFKFSDHNIIVDMKSQLRLSSEISESHAAQVSLYCKAQSEPYEGRVAYITNKKAATYQVENIDQHVDGLVRIAMKIEAFLSRFDNVDDLARVLTPSTDTFYYNDAATRQKAFEIFGI